MVELCRAWVPLNVQYNSSLVGLLVAAGNVFFLLTFECDNDALLPIVDIVD
jgi:hypothetical protein